MNHKQKVEYMIKNNLLPRFCEDTLAPMSEGFLYTTSQETTTVEERVLEEVKIAGYASLEEAYEDEFYYWTDWEIDPDDSFYDMHGDRYENLDEYLNKLED